MPCYFVAPCDKRKHTAHNHQQAASQASTDSACRHPVWLPHSSLGFQRPIATQTDAKRDCGLFYFNMEPRLNLHPEYSLVSMLNMQYVSAYTGDIYCLDGNVRIAVKLVFKIGFC